MKQLIFCALLVLNLSVLAQEWQPSWIKAQQMASKQSKPIVLVFSGSDWCAPCMKMDRRLFSTSDFQEYAKQHYVLYKADFPRKSKNQLDAQQTKVNKELAEQYNPQGYFPFVVVLDAKGKVLGSTGYEKLAPKAFVEELATFLE